MRASEREREREKERKRILEFTEITLKETSKNWKSNQQSGMKGSSTNHALIEVWDRIHRALDKSSHNKAVILRALDFFLPLLAPRDFASIQRSRWQ